MGCCESIYIYKAKKLSSINHNMNDLMFIGELDGHVFNYYYDIRHNVILRNWEPKFIQEQILNMGGSKIIPLINDKDQYIYYCYYILIERLKKKYREKYLLLE